jgi:prepilin signal peptidase PulO-like enzyme (type II secretory pathway)
MSLLTDLSPSLLAILAFIFGLAIGSFLNVVIHRVPLGESIVRPGSRCPQCRQPLRALDNIPLLSFALQRGRCRACQAWISPVYPLVELLTALLFAVVVWQTGGSWLALAQMAFIAVMLALIFIDAEHKILPDVIIYPAFVGVLAASALRSGGQALLTPQVELLVYFGRPFNDFVLRDALLFGALILALAAPAFWLLDWLDVLLFDRYFHYEEEPIEESESEKRRERIRQRVIIGTMLCGLLLAAVWVLWLYRMTPENLPVAERAYNGLLRAASGAFGGAGAVWLLRCLYFLMRKTEGMGLGDVKMLALIGAFLGWYWAFVVLLYGSILGAVAGVIMAYRNKTGMRVELPFGIFLGAMAIVTLLYVNARATFN